MPALAPTDHYATITWLGRVPDRDRSLRSERLDTLEVGFDGPAGETHGGLTRASCSRVTAQHPTGTEIANVRQLTVLSVEEMAQTAAAMGLDALDPALVGASVIVEGLVDVSHLPPSSRLQGPDGVTLVIDMQNRPCHLPAREITEAVGPEGKTYKTAAQGRRGVTAWIERPGRLSVGDRLRLHVPDQRPWQGLPRS